MKQVILISEIEDQIGICSECLWNTLPSCIFQGRWWKLTNFQVGANWAQGLGRKRVFQLEGAIEWGWLQYCFKVISYNVIWSLDYILTLRCVTEGDITLHFKRPNWQEYKNVLEKSNNEIRTVQVRNDIVPHCGSGRK